MPGPFSVAIGGRSPESVHCRKGPDTLFLPTLDELAAEEDSAMVTQEPNRAVSRSRRAQFV
jgi:hypothetical protein